MIALRRRIGTIWQRSDCLAADLRASAVNFGTVSDTIDAISGDSSQFPAKFRQLLMGKLGNFTLHIGFKVCHYEGFFLSSIRSRFLAVTCVGLKWAHNLGVWAE